ncbi:MAG: hypothetical protein ACI854_001649 [Arenicella sp.]|jgi:hypothetical protein
MTLFIKSLNYGSFVSIALACAGSLCGSNANAEGAVFATQITSQNAPKLISMGPDAIGGVGDWFFTNGTVCAIVSGVNHEGQFSTKGGSLVDLGFCGRADDHFTATHDLLQGSRKRPVDATKISHEQTEKSATIVVQGERDGTAVTTRYSLDLSRPNQVHVIKKISYHGGEKFNFFSALNFNYHSLESFVLNSQDLMHSNGFEAEEFSSRGVTAMNVAARNADTIIALSPPTAETGIAYGWHLESAQRVNGDQRYDLPRFMLADESSNAMLILSDTFYLGDGTKIGWLQLPQLPLLSLDEDSQIETHEIIYVGNKGHVASITDQLFSDAPLVSGKLNETNAAIHIATAEGVPFTHVRPDDDGRFAFRVPIGTYSLRIKGTAERELQRTIDVSKNLNLGSLELPKAAVVLLPQGHAMRILFVGINGSKSPDFGDRLTGFSVQDDDGVNYIATVPNLFLAGVDSDIKSVEIAPGQYQIYATKGPEYSLEKTILEVKPQATQALDIAIPSRAVASPNYIASDLHVHSGVSFDNAFSESERVRTFVAEHGEVMVSSEHDVPVDYATQIAALGVSDKIISIAAAEVTSLLPTTQNKFTGGHANFFPYTPDPYAYRRGMVNHEDKRWREIIYQIKQQQGEQVLVQLNHARLRLALSGELPNNWQELVEDGNFLDHMGPANHPYNPGQPLHSHPNNSLIEKHPETGARDLDIDLFEIINPGGKHNSERIEALRRDWLSFVKQGEKIVATANSDSHRSSEQVAVPRTMVAMADDRVTSFKQSEFIAALKSGNAYGTTGPLLDISLSGAKMGSTFSGQRGQLSLKIVSAEWIPVSTVKIQINGETVDQHELNSRHEHSILVPLSFDKDSFVTVEISGQASIDYQRVYPNLEPYAFSNPIYVDFDSDGKWQPPGL